MFGDNIYYRFFQLLGQMMVAVFLFYSGYGIFVSASEKGKKYIKDFPKKRILKTYLFFAAAVLLYLIVGLLRGKSFATSQIALSFIGWESLGNSNWFMFAIIFLYIATYISALITKRQINIKTIILITFISLAYVVALYKLKPGETWWCDTVLCYAAGMTFACYKNQIDSLLNKRYYLATIPLILFFGVYYFMVHSTGITIILMYDILSCLFCIIISAITYHIKIDNTLLQFLGRYGFEIYILQRIPDILFQPVLGDYAIPFFLISFSCTILISVAYQKFMTTAFAKIIDNQPTKRLKHQS